MTDRLAEIEARWKGPFPGPNSPGFGDGVYGDDFRWLTAEVKRLRMELCNQHHPSRSCEVCRD